MSKHSAVTVGYKQPPLCWVPPAAAFFYSVFHRAQAAAASAACSPRFAGGVFRWRVFFLPSFARSHPLHNAHSPKTNAPCCRRPSGRGPRLQRQASTREERAREGVQKRSRKIVFFCLATTALPAKRDRERESDESLIRKPSPASRLAPCQASSSRGRERKVEVPALQRRERENHPSLVPPKRKRIPKELHGNASATSSLFFFFSFFGCVFS